MKSPSIYWEVIFLHFFAEKFGNVKKMLYLRTKKRK